MWKFIKNLEFLNSYLIDFVDDVDAWHIFSTALDNID